MAPCCARKWQQNTFPFPLLGSSKNKNKKQLRWLTWRFFCKQVLFFEDQVIVNRFQENIPLYADRFPTWSSQSNAMLQYAVWTALEAEGLGANLQHYNPLVDQRVAAEWKVPVDWKLSAQLVFGAKTGEAGPKEFAPLEEKYKSYGA